MATATTTKKATAPRAIKKAPGASSVSETPVVVEEKKPVELMPNMLVPCVSMVRNGKLIYVSHRTIGYKILWNSFGEMQYVELGELVAMKSTDFAFYEKNWISIPDSYELKQEVIEYLGVGRYLKDAVDAEAIDELLRSSAGDIIDKVSALPQGSKDAVRTVAERAITNGTMDSLQKIHALELALDCKLI